MTIQARHIKTGFLLTAIVVGGLLGPLSHLLFMVSVGAHEMPGEMVLHSDSVSGSAVQSSDDVEHASCPYLELYATVLAIDLVPETAANFTSPEWAVVPLPTPFVHRNTSFNSNGVRGPPVES